MFRAARRWSGVEASWFEFFGPKGPNLLRTWPVLGAVAGENQEKGADEETAVLLKRFSDNPDVEKAKAKFERAQKVEESFNKDFDGLDLAKQ
jgi:hypothetical protein